MLVQGNKHKYKTPKKCSLVKTDTNSPFNQTCHTFSESCGFGIRFYKTKDTFFNSITSDNIFHLISHQKENVDR